MVCAFLFHLRTVYGIAESDMVQWLTLSYLHYLPIQILYMIPQIPTVISTKLFLTQASFKRSTFHCFSANHMDKPLTTACRVGKISNKGENIVNSVLWAGLCLHSIDQSGSLPNRMLSDHLGTDIHKPSSSLFDQSRTIYGSLFKW